MSSKKKTVKKTAEKSCDNKAVGKCGLCGGVVFHNQTYRPTCSNCGATFWEEDKDLPILPMRPKPNVRPFPPVPEVPILPKVPDDWRPLEPSPTPWTIPPWNPYPNPTVPTVPPGWPYSPTVWF